jgi:hypothetical protein
MTDLWPSDLATVAAKPPGTILKEQAALLGMKTKNIVNASVQPPTNYHEKPFSFDFSITSPVLGNYTYPLFRISYDIGLYPVKFTVEDALARELGVGRESGQLGELIAEEEGEFIQILSRILGSKRTRQVIGGILSHATGQSLNDNGTPG